MGISGRDVSWWNLEEGDGKRGDCCEKRWGRAKRRETEKGKVVDSNVAVLRTAP